ncbi:MAG: Holliday junction resolvase RuvX [Pseudomonadota bacterium]|nr:Holliday junction resolvase RuvX [Pseudomonadota bacterium]
MPAVVRAPTAHRHLSFLAFDFGSRRIGVAAGNTLTRNAQPLCTVAAGAAPPFDAIGRLIAEWLPDALVVGVPLHPDGAPHENTLRARRFARQLQGRFKLPVHEADERYTTTEARALGAADLDAAAAAIILGQFLREHEMGGAAPLQ